VSKETKEGRTVSEIRLLDRQERVNELARMLGGLSAAARKHAEELLATNEKPQASVVTQRPRYALSR